MRKFPFVKQHDSMQCGVACLAMVCRHWGRAYSTAYLAGRCTPTSEGVSLKAIADAARGLGIDTVSARLTLGALALLALFAAVMMMPFPYGEGETLLGHWLGQP